MEKSVQDGAFAWLLCFACFFNITIIGGFIFASGMFYIMFKENLDASDSEVSLITAINISLMHIVCPIAGILCERYGNRCIAMIGVVLSIVGQAAAAFSTQISHLYISYGVLAGTGLGMVFPASVAMIDPYFNKHKRTACGLTITGFGVGSFIVPPILTHLEHVYGWRGAVLMMAGVSAHLMVTCSLFRPFQGETNKQCDIQLVEITKNDEPHSENEMMICSKEDDCKTSVERKEPNGLQHKLIRAFSIFKIIPFLCILLATLIYTFPVSIVATHFGSYVLTIGFSSEDVVKLYMTFGLTASIGRLLAGIIAQVTNANPALFIMVTMFLDGVVTLAVPFMDQLWMLYVYAVFFQLLMAPYNVCGAVIVMEYLPSPKVALAYGLYQAFCVPGYLLAPPLVVWLHQYTKVYSHSFFLAGGLVLLAALTWIPAVIHIHRRRTKTPKVPDGHETCQVD